MLARLTYVLCTLALFCGASIGHAQTTWYVDSTATPPGNGTPGSPYTSIQYALSRATTLNGHTVVVLPGTYAENIDFLGKAVRLVSSGGPTMTVIDGGGSLVGLSAVTFATGEGPGSVLQGFTVENGTGTQGPSFVDGGGVRISGASPTIRDCVLQQNEAGRGAGLFSENGSPRIEDCALKGNVVQTGWGGAGAWFSGGSPWLVDTVVENNGTPSFGGGLYFESGLPSLLRTTIRDNYSNSADGGGVYLIGCPQASFVDCVVSGNSCWDGGWGGDLAAESSTITMTGCRIDSNGAYNDHVAGGIGISGTFLWFTGGEITNNVSTDGGGISAGIVGIWTGATLLLEDSVLAGNTAQAGGAGGGDGGGLHVAFGSSATVRRCLFDSNQAFGGPGGTGGAVYGPAELEHCTLVNNVANNDGGGACGASLDSCIAYFNTPLGTCSSPDVTYSDVEGGHAGIGNVDADPLFWNMAGGDFHLEPGSPCIDTGSPASPLDPDGSRADMGAFPFDDGYCPARGELLHRRNVCLGLPGSDLLDRHAQRFGSERLPPARHRRGGQEGRHLLLRHQRPPGQPLGQRHELPVRGAAREARHGAHRRRDSRGLQRELRLRPECPLDCQAGHQPWPRGPRAGPALVPRPAEHVESDDESL